MRLNTRGLLCVALVLGGMIRSSGQDTARSYRIFQFPQDQIPRIDGNDDDWKMVPDSYAVGMDQLRDDSHQHATADPRNLNVTVKVGWVKGMNRLYFLYEAYDNYWDFSRTDLHNDIFELVVDGDRSGGPFIARFHPSKQLDPMDAYFSFQNVQAQNYHIFTPARGKEWAMVWGPQNWIRKLPYANAACQYHFSPGDSGKLILEFWITPFDYVGAEGPRRAVETVLKENHDVGLSWAVIDYDDVDAKGNNGFWNLSKHHTMYGNADYLLPFKLMPLESRFHKPIEARWDFQVLDKVKRVVWFSDRSYGDIRSWKWDFGDGTTSNEPSPRHRYQKQGQYVVTLWVEGPRGKSRCAKVWDVTLK